MAAPKEAEAQQHVPGTGAREVARSRGRVAGARALGKGRAARLRGRWVGTYNVCGMRMEPRAPDGKDLQWEEIEGLSQEEVARVVAAPSAKTRQVVDAIVASSAAIFACTDIHVVEGSREMAALQTYLQGCADLAQPSLPPDEEVHEELRRLLRTFLGGGDV